MIVIKNITVERYIFLEIQYYSIKYKYTVNVFGYGIEAHYTIIYNDYKRISKQLKKQLKKMVADYINEFLKNELP